MTRRRSTRDLIAESHHSTQVALAASMLRLVGVTVLCLFVGLVPLVFDPAADWPFPIPKALLSHGLAYILAAILIGLFTRFGRSVIPWSWLHVPVLAFFAVNVLATVFAVDPYLALYGSHERMLGLGTIGAWTLLYFAVVAMVRTRSDVRVLFAVFLAAAFSMLIYEVVQLLRVDPFHWSLDTAARPISTNGQPTTLGAYLAIAAVASSVAALLTRGLARRFRLSLGIVSAVMLLGASLTGTRSSLIGLAGAATVLVALLWLRGVTPSQRRLSVFVAAAASLLIVALVTLTPIGARLLQSEPVDLGTVQTGGSRLDVSSLEVRGLLYQVAIDAVHERPLLGYGPDNFTVAMERHRPETGPDESRLSYATSAHGWIGQTAVGSGLLGLGTFVALVITAAALVVRRTERASVCVAAAIIAAFLGTGVTTVSDVASDWIFWMAAAFIAMPIAPETVETDQRAESPRKRGRTRVASVSKPEILCLVVGIGIALSVIGAFQASRSAHASQDLRLLGQAAPALRSALDATASDPGRAEYWRALGLACVANQRWRDAAAAFDKAIQAAPWDARNVNDLMQTQLVLARDGDASARLRVVQLADDVVRADPNHPDAQFARATALQFVGHNEDALRAIERAMTLLPGSNNERWYVVATQLYVAVGRPADGVDIATRALTIVGPTVALRTELARALIASGRLDEALVQVAAILSADPKNAVAIQLRTQIQSAMTH